MSCRPAAYLKSDAFWVGVVVGAAVAVILGRFFGLF